MMSCGTKTSEFWLIVAFLITSSAMGFYAIHKGHEYLLGTAAIIGAIATNTVGYALARVSAKNNEVKKRNSKTIKEKASEDA